MGAYQNGLYSEEVSTGLAQSFEERNLSAEHVSGMISALRNHIKELKAIILEQESQIHELNKEILLARK